HEPVFCAPSCLTNVCNAGVLDLPLLRSMDLPPADAPPIEVLGADLRVLAASSSAHPRTIPAREMRRGHVASMIRSPPGGLDMRAWILSTLPLLLLGCSREVITPTSASAGSGAGGPGGEPCVDTGGGSGSCSE